MTTLRPVRDRVLDLLPRDVDRTRYQILISTLSDWKELFLGKRVLDFGASYGTSLVALINLGAREVVGVEPDLSRVTLGRELIPRAVPGARASLEHVSDTAALPFADGSFAFILANAVLEHIPQPRDAYILELWRLVSEGGYLMINETPNKYFPKEVHTTGLWWNHWLPRSLAHWRAIRRRRFDARRTDWDSSGWRGLGYFELVRSLRHYQVVPEHTRLRHWLLEKLGLPPSVLDPYPCWVFKKLAPT